MGKIYKYSNLYNRRGELVRKAPIEALPQFKQRPMPPHKYPGNTLTI